MFFFVMNVIVGYLLRKQLSNQRLSPNVLQGALSRITVLKKEKSVVRAKWPIRPELIPVSVA